MIRSIQVPLRVYAQKTEKGRTERIHGSASSDYAPGDGNMKTRPPVTMLQIFSSLIHILKFFIFILN